MSILCLTKNKNLWNCEEEKNRVYSLKGIINIVIEHQGNASFVQMYLVEFYPNTCIRRMIKEPSTGYQRGN